MTEIPVSFGEWVLSRRKQLDLTRNELALKVGCSPVTIKKIERDERKPSRQIAELLATYLEIETERYDLFVQKARGGFVEAISVPGSKDGAISNENGSRLKSTHSHGVLPEQTGAFIGREQEIGYLSDMLADPAQRLISLIGTGGMGKSRLAIEMGRLLIENQSEAFFDGIYYADFNAHRDSSHIVPVIAKAVGLDIKKGTRIGQNRLPQEQLLDWLRPKQILLILDNVDHLIDETTIILELLETAPRLRMIVTSRERLNLQQEQIFPVQGLDYPNSSDEVDRYSYPAVDLFLEVAHRIKPEFELTAENLDAVIRLCRIVEGMPLSIELAAAWIDLLSPAEIADEIKNSLDFLETNLRNFPERHRSMRAVFDASWEKLRSSDKKIFARLSIFRGIFSRRAAQTVAGASLPVLGRLVDRSLASYDSKLEAYRINELLHQYGADQLEQIESKESRNDLRERHSIYYLEALDERSELIKGNGQIGTGQKTAGQTLALDQIGRDMKNIRFAWEWAVDNLKQDLILTGMEPLANFLEFKGRYHEGEKIFAAFTQKLEIKRGDQSPEECRLLLCGYSFLSMFEFARENVGPAQLSIDKANRLVEKLTELDVEIDREQAFVQVLTGHLKEKESLGDAIPYYLQALDLYRKHDMGWEQAALMTTLGSVARLQGDHAKASTWLDESLKIRQRIGDQIGAAETLASMSELSRYRGQCFDATIMAQSSVDLARQIGNDNVLAFGLVNLGMSYYYGGEFAKQHRCLIEALAIYESLHNTNRLPDVYYRLSLANAALGQYDASATNAQHGLNLARQTGNVVHMVNLFYVQAVAFLAAGSFDSGKQLMQHSLDVFPEVGQKTHRKCGIIMLIGYGEYNLGNPTPAKRHFYQALEFAAEMADQIAFILVFGISALVLADQGLNKEAVILWRMVQRFSPPFQKAAWLRAIYGDRLAEIEHQMSSEEMTEIEEYLQRNSMVDEARALLAYMNKEGWNSEKRD